MSEATIMTNEAQIRKEATLVLEKWEKHVLYGFMSSSDKESVKKITLDGFMEKLKTLLK